MSKSILPPVKNKISGSSTSTATLSKSNAIESGIVDDDINENRTTEFENLLLGTDLIAIYKFLPEVPNNPLAINFTEKGIGHFMEMAIKSGDTEAQKYFIETAITQDKLSTIEEYLDTEMIKCIYTSNTFEEV